MRAGKLHICEVVRFWHTKGAGVTAVWGIALDFVPEATSTRLKWKREPQDLYLDLVWFPVDYDEAIRAESMERHKRVKDALNFGVLPKPERMRMGLEWYVSLLDPLDLFEARAHELATITAKEAVVFLDRITNLNDVANLLAFQRSYPYLGLGFFNHVQPPLAYAFLLARLGRAEDARKAYAEYGEKIHVGQAVRPKLNKAFAETLASPFAD